MRPIVLLGLLAIPATAGALDIDLAQSPGDWVAWGSQAYGGAGAGTAIGDVNGDGVADLVVSERDWDDGASTADAGRVLIFLGPIPLPGQIDLLSALPSVAIVGSAVKTSLGLTLLLADADGDGLQDLVVGSTADKMNSGSIEIFRGRNAWPPLLTSSDADWSFHAAEPYDRMNSAAVGDLNGDGSPDIALGAPGASASARPDAGEVYVFLGPAQSWKRSYDLAVDIPDVRILGSDPDGDNPPNSDGISLGDQMGLKLAVGDVVGDATPDLIVTARLAAGPGNTRPEAGEAYIFGGRTIWPSVIDLRTASPDLLVSGPGSRDDQNLLSIAIGDWDADGVNDLVLGGIGTATLDQEGAGAVFVLRGRNQLAGAWDLASKPADETIRGPRIRARMGNDLAMADVDGDGYLDIIAVGGTDWTPYNRRRAGGVYVVAGCPGYEPVRDLGQVPPELGIYGADVEDALSVHLSGIGDFNDDGKADMLLGAFFGDGPDNTRVNAGEAHLVLGRTWRVPCSISADAGPGAVVCGSQDVTLDASGTDGASCPGPPAFRWSLGTTVVRDWSADPTVIVRPEQTSTYRVDVRCGDCAGTTCSASATVRLDVYADVVPPELGNTLRALRASGGVSLAWTAVPEALTFTLYRDTLKDVAPSELQSGLAAPAITLPDLTGPPELYFYRAAGASCSGRQGPP